VFVCSMVKTGYTVVDFLVKYRSMLQATTIRHLKCLKIKWKQQLTYNLEATKSQQHQKANNDIHKPNKFKASDLVWAATLLGEITQ